METGPQTCGMLKSQGESAQSYVSLPLTAIATFAAAEADA